MNFTVGIDVGGTKTALGLFTERHVLVEKLVIPSDQCLSLAEMLHKIGDGLNSVLSAAKIGREAVKGVGIGLPGAVLFEKGMLLFAPNLPNWAGRNVKALAEEAFGLPCVVDNDANVAALAEFTVGAGQGSKNMAFVTVSTGVGCGLVLDGKLFHGAYGFAGELGHLFISDDQTIRCGCGRTSCVEAQSSGTAMAGYAKRRIVEGAKSILPSLAGGAEHITAKHISDALTQGDPLAQEVAGRAAEGLARAFYNVYQLLNCDTLVYGGGVGQFGPKLFDRVERRFFELIPLAKEYPMRFVPAHLGGDAGMAGAALLAAQSIV